MRCYHPGRLFRASALLENQESWNIYWGQISRELNQLGSTSLLGYSLIKFKSHVFS